MHNYSQEENIRLSNESYKSATSRFERTKTYTDEEYHKYHQYTCFGNDRKNDTLFKLNFGDIILYQEIDRGNQVYPKLAIFIEMLPADQTLEFCLINKKRTWMDNVEYLSNPNYDSWMEVSWRNSEVSSIIPWGDDEIMIFGRWESMPNWKQLRRAYEKTMWFGLSESEIRQRKINSLI